MRIAICAALPFADAAVVIEGLSGWGDDIQLHVHGWPWTAGERWPMAIPSFTVRAIDDFGGEHEARPGSWRGYGAGEGHRDFTLWPAVPAQVSKLRAVVSTLWETAWTDIDLGPARPEQPQTGPAARMRSQSRIPATKCTATRAIGTISLSCRTPLVAASDGSGSCRDSMAACLRIRIGRWRGSKGLTCFDSPRWLPTPRPSSSGGISTAPADMPVVCWAGPCVRALPCTT